MPGLVLFGGSFNPVHNGHLLAARTALQATGADTLLFVPTGTPPLRTRTDMAPGAHRLAMLRCAIADEPMMAVSDAEISRDGPSYTVDTVEELTADMRVTLPLYFLLGADCLGFLPGWKGIDRLHALLSFAILPRNGVDLTELDPRFLRIPMPPASVSATEVRARVAARQSLDGLVPDSVATYIHKHGLYRPPPASRAYAGMTDVHSV